MALTDEDKVEIKQTLEDEVLGTRPSRVPVPPRSRPRTTGASRSAGELSHERQHTPARLRSWRSVRRSQVSGRATVKQSDWGIKPYSGLFGTLKVRDEVEVVAEGSLPK